MKPRFLLLTLGMVLTMSGCSLSLSSSESASGSASASESGSTSQTSSSSSSQKTSSSSASESGDYDSLPEIEEDSRWPVDFSQRGYQFMVTLSGLIKKTGGTASYSSAISIGAKAAAYPNENSSTFIPFYRGPSSENLAKQNECNREHTWPDSRGGGMFENDPVMIRPTFTKDNSSRGNSFYGLGNNEWDPATFGYENARGEAARVILYSVVTYYDLGVSLSNNPSDSSGNHTMGTLKTLLKWNRDYAPNDFEKTVNDRYDKMGYRRNPFVDHPGYADYIYDDQGLRTSGETKWYERVADDADLDGKKVMIVSADPKASGYYMMNDTAKSASLPWYITCTAVRFEDGKVSMGGDPTYYTLAKSGDAYTVSTSSGQRLYGYVSGGHYSICLGKSSADVTSHSSGATDISDTWKITLSGGFASFANTNGKVWLECYSGSFCGYSKDPSTKPMLFA